MSDLLSNTGPAGSPPQDLVLVGHVSGAYGVKGWVRIRKYSQDADALLHAKTWWLDQSGDCREVDVMQAKGHGEDVVAQLMGVADRDMAEGLKGAAVQVRRAHFPSLDDDEFYWVDLIGLRVENLQGDLLGEVADLMDNGAHPILRVVAQAPVSEAAPGQKKQEVLIPFVEQFVQSVDKAGRKIIVDWESDY